MKITVIVPVYGVEEYLDSCVKSIVDQTYTDLEIILVDDGGKDRCPQMCDEWSKKDERIKVIHKKNGGQGTARNAALDVMTGDYVTFVDSDDLILPDMIELLVKATKNGTIDCAMCGFSVDDGIKKIDIQWYNCSDICSNKKIMSEFFTTDKITRAPYCKLISKNIMQSIRFPSFRANEDAYIMHEIVGSCKSVVIIPERLYIQRLRLGSTERSGFNENKMHLLDCAYALRQYVKDKYPEYYENTKDRVAKECLVLLKKLYGENVYKKFPACEAKLRAILQEEMVNLPVTSKNYSEAELYFKYPCVFKALNICRYKKACFKSGIKNTLLRKTDF